MSGQRPFNSYWKYKNKIESISGFTIHGNIFHFYNVYVRRKTTPKNHMINDFLN